MISSRRRREDVAVPLRRRLLAEPPRVLREALTEQSRSPLEPTLVECLREVFAVPSWSIHAMGSPWRRRKGFATSSRALKASRRYRVAFAQPSRSLHPSPRMLRGAFLKASRGAHGVFIWKRFVKITTSPPTITVLLRTHCF